MRLGSWRDPAVARDLKVLASVGAVVVLGARSPHDFAAMGLTALAFGTVIALMLKRRRRPVSDDPPEHAQPASRPVVTLAMCTVCCLLFLAIAAQGGERSWETLARWGYLPATGIWEGAYWGLVTSAFVHLSLWHVVFNVYWFWILGGSVERSLGPLRYSAFVLASAAVSSLVQLAVSGATGYGASGVVYAFFGLMWAARKQESGFQNVLGERTAPLFWIWLVGCVVATSAGLANVGNGAHFGGLAFGVLVAYWLVLKDPRRERLALGALVLVMVLSSVAALWSPWSPTWVGYRAYKSHLARHYDEAIAGYRRSISLGGNRVWALESLALAYKAKGAEKEYVATLEELRVADAKAAAGLEARVGAPGDSGSSAERR